MGSGAAVPEDPWMRGAYRSEEADTPMDTGSGGQVVSNKYFPQREFLKFETQVKPEPVIKKLKEFNTIVPEHLRLLDSVLEQLPSLTSSSSPDPGLVSSLLTVLKWPDLQSFPGLDILRASLLNPAYNPLLMEKSALDEIFSLCLRHLDNSSPPNCQMLSLRYWSFLLITKNKECSFDISDNKLIVLGFYVIYSTVRRGKLS